MYAEMHIDAEAYTFLHSGIAACMAKSLRLDRPGT